MTHPPATPALSSRGPRALIAAAFLLGRTIGGWSNLPEPQRQELEIVYREIMESHIEPHLRDWVAL